MTDDRSTPLDPLVLGGVPVLPVVVVDDASIAARLGRTLRDAGIPQVEVTLRTEAAASAIASMADVDGLLIGAGTVRVADDVDRAVEAGARFVVSPGLVEPVLDRAAQLGVLAIPGVATASEALRALALGCTTVKFFPASTSGGPSALRAFADVLPELSFLPTGGIDLASAPDYLALPAVLAVGGSWMVPRAAVLAGDLDAIATLSAQAAGLRS